MNELDYKPNSHKYRAEHAQEEQKKRVEKPIITSTVKTKKKSELHKFADIFISEDAKNVKSYVLMDVLVPAIKKAISDIVRDGIDMLLYGDTSRSKRSSNSPYVSYRDYSGSRRDDDRRNSSRTRSGYSYDDIILETRGEAEEVLSQMDALIETYNDVSVADLYDLVGKSCNYTDYKYGWTNLRNAEAVRVRDGYLLKLPRAVPIKN